MNESLAAISSPSREINFENYAEQLAFDFYDLLSPSYWILKAMNLLGIAGIFREFINPFSGDYDKMAEHSGAYINLGKSLQHLADEINYRNRNVTDTLVWRGLAANNFSAHMTEMSSDIRRIGLELQEAGESFETVAHDIYNEYVFVNDAIRIVFDAVCDIVSCFIKPIFLYRVPGLVMNGVKRVMELLKWLNKIPMILARIRSILKVKITSISLKTLHKSSSFANYMSLRPGLLAYRLADKVPGKAGDLLKDLAFKQTFKSTQRTSDMVHSGEKAIEWGTSLPKNLKEDYKIARKRWWEGGASRSWRAFLAPEKIIDDLPVFDKYERLKKAQNVLNRLDKHPISAYMLRGAAAGYHYPIKREDDIIYPTSLMGTAQLDDDVYISKDSTNNKNNSSDKPDAYMRGIGIPGSELGTTTKVKRS